MVSKTNKNQLVTNIAKSTNISELASKVAQYSDSMIAVMELINLTYAYCEKVRSENMDIYNENIKPLVIIVSDCEKSLQNENLTIENKKEIYTALFQAQKNISTEGEKVIKSKKRDLAIAGGGISIGIIAGIIIKTINSFAKKS